MPPQSSSTLPGYVAIRDILDGNFANKSLVNVYGLVSGFREAMQTKGKGPIIWVWWPISLEYL
ncbi:hypothetical protein LB505_007157 [Fusarium chuoi]|nr:hypothetical protein LB505_007157 [Fusarium chuoi]